MVRKWCRAFHKGRCKEHNESHTGYPKVMTDESVNTIRVLLNEDRRLILQELKTIMMKKSKLLHKIISQIWARSSTNRAYKN